MIFSHFTLGISPYLFYIEKYMYITQFETIEKNDRLSHLFLGFLIYLSLWQGLAVKRSRHFLIRTIMTSEIIFVGSLQICMGVYRSFEILKDPTKFFPRDI